MQNHSKEACGRKAESGLTEYPFAGFWVRLAAYAIDMLIVTAGLLVVRLLFLGIDSLLAGTFLEGGILFHYTLKDIILYMLQVLYFILFTYHTGTTLGKKALNLCVIRSDSKENLSLLNVIYRETIGRFLCGFIFCIGYIIAGLDEEKRGIHDRLCDTRVIYAKPVKVYPVYHKTYTGQNIKSDDEEKSRNDFVPRMVEESQPVEMEEVVIERKAPENIEEQWKKIIEGDS